MFAKIAEQVRRKISRARAIVGDSGLKTAIRLQEKYEFWQEKKPPPTLRPMRNSGKIMAARAAKISFVIELLKNVFFYCKLPAASLP